jgi:hypothetical protein
MPDKFSEYYKDHIDNTYDVVDRIILNGYYTMAQSHGGFRTWWKNLMGDDKNLNNTRLMRFAGKFARRISAYAMSHNIPLIKSNNERKHEIAEKYIPEDPEFRGVFCILKGRAPAPVRDIKQCKNGCFHISTKTPYPYVNHYYFHIMDPQWGHIMIRFCPHPPFNVQIALNGHEYVAKQAKKKGVSFTKEGNCFTKISDIAAFAGIADTMRASRSVGHLVKVCDRWIYSSCLCFALELSEQEKSGFHYSYSVYQAEYSRNLLFTRGKVMDQVFNSVVDRTRASLDIKTMKTIFGYKHRPFYRTKKNKLPRFETVIEKPEYNMTIFKFHFGRLTVKIYTKGENVIRIETVAHNTKDLRCGKKINKFPQIIKSLKDILEKFLSVLRSVDISFIDIGTLDEWPLHSKVGATKVGGVDVNSNRIRSTMKAVIALSKNPRGFTSSQLAEKVRKIMGLSESFYNSRKASYDIKKFRGKNLVRIIPKSRRYEVTQKGIRQIVAFLTLRDKVLNPLLSGVSKSEIRKNPENMCDIDIHYEKIIFEMKNIFKIIGIAA